MLGVGAVVARPGPSTPFPGSRIGEAPPEQLFTDLVHLDNQLDRAIKSAKKNDLTGGEVSNVEDAMSDLIKRDFTQTLYGVKFREVFHDLNCVGVRLDHVSLLLASGVSGAPGLGTQVGQLEVARSCKQRLEKKLHTAAQQPSQVTISEDDTWAHNPDIGKSRICINVRTSPPQASVSARITGPGDYEAEVGRSPLHADGSGQIRGIITQAGKYTKTLVVYDASGKQTATVTKTFTVAEPPQDGPKTDPPCVKPTE